MVTPFDRITHPYATTLQVSYTYTMTNTVSNYEVQTIGDSTTTQVEKCCISWTGGKDCNLALLAAWRDPSLHVTDLVVFQPENKQDFEAHPLRIMRQQSKSLGLTLRIMILPTEIKYRDGYVNAFKQLRDEYGLQVICTGDMDLVGSYQNNWMEECAEMAGDGIRTSLPLWKADRDSCLNSLLDEKFVVVFSCVKSPWFDESWCGRKLDVDSYKEMKIMSENPLYDEKEMINWGPKDPRREVLDLGGENGEYHTMILDGPMYSYCIEIVGTTLVEEDVNNNNNNNNHSNSDTNSNSNGGTSDEKKGEEENIIVSTKTKIKIKPKAVVTEPAKNGVEDRWWTYDGQTRWSFSDDFDVVAKVMKTVI